MNKQVSVQIREQTTWYRCEHINKDGSICHSVGNWLEFVLKGLCHKKLKHGRKIH